MRLKEKEKALLEYLDELNMYYYALGIMEYDAHTIIPEKGYDSFVKASSFFASKAFKMKKEEKYLNLVETLNNNKEQLHPLMKPLVKNLQKDIDDSNAIPVQEMEEYHRLTNESYAKWQQAKENNDFNLWVPYLKKIVETTRKFISYRKKQFSTPYNALLDDYEEGMNEEKLDNFFNSLKENIVPLLKRIVEKNKKLPLDCLSYKVAIARQKEFNQYILKTLQFDLTSGYITTSAHPFTSGIAPNDVRLTTRFLENDFTYNLYSTIHEAGHGIYDQNEPKLIHKFHLDGGTSCAVHEMHSRFYENYIGKSKEFINLITPKLKKTFKGNFKNLSENDLYLAVNKIEPSLIRTESDELTYSLHILIRYEIEKDLINGKIEVEDLPKIWNNKYQEYLGITPENDSVGIMQDVHWSDGSFGYFPSYALGNAYAAQVLNKLKKEIDFYQLINNNQLKVIKNWLINNTFKYGRSISPDEWIVNVTGEPLNVNYYVNYLKEKFGRIYEL